ncbi:hypothetical protein EDC94DRAFT_613739 [Helicostylum pulchrum]|uniref:Uncharacterized protein n=1 Tax=Helicostylum pulchrum TaxID=562976 RepID=A0ABP9XUB3_9FUNG|nr:hypothetical protein EDC94DRAFT_613739 [Helicostylum pulchrum]
MTEENGHTKHTEGIKTEKKKTVVVSSSPQFVKRVTSLPLVQESVSTAQALANKTTLGRFALSKANSTVNSVTYFATHNQPIQTYYQSYFQPHVQRVDNIGCRSLDVIESKVPLINQPTADIYQSMTQPTYQIIGHAKLKLDSTISTVTHPAHVVIEETNKRFGTYVDTLENAVDQFLPAASASASSSEEGKRQVKNDNQVLRVYGVLNEASRRISERVKSQINTSTAGIPKSRQDLSRLVETNSVLQSISGQIKMMQELAVQSLTVYSSAAQERLPSSVNLRIQQTSELFNHVSVSVNQQLGHLTEYLKTQPEWVKEKLTGLIETTKQQLEMIKQELSRSDVSLPEKLKHLASNLQEQLLPLVEQMSSQLATLSGTVREKARHELNVPLYYFGLTQKVKTQ